VEKQGPIVLARGYLDNAYQKLESGEKDIKSARYSKSIRSFQTCMELSLKAIYLMLDVEYKRKHSQKGESLAEILEKIPDELSHYRFPRLLIMVAFWNVFDTMAKLGLQHIGVGPDDILSKHEAELAREHASECYSAGSGVQVWYARTTGRH